MTTMLLSWRITLERSLRLTSRSGLQWQRRANSSCESWAFGHCAQARRPLLLNPALSSLKFSEKVFALSHTLAKFIAELGLKAFFMIQPAAHIHVVVATKLGHIFPFKGRLQGVGCAGRPPNFKGHAGTLVKGST